MREMHNEGNGFGVPFTLLGHRLLLVRYKSELFVTSSVCPHQSGNLALGEILDVEDFTCDHFNAQSQQRRILISCPNHNWKFCVRTGVNIGSEKDPSRSLPRYHLKTDVVGFEKYFFISGFGIGRPVDDLGQSAPASKRKFLMRRETAM
eukprot:GEMP01060981.1.p2 GENE.GEMP01060981.1~~GEMP01060981.1.p2  ORF type:complete len:149 (+),score=27.79 GEMP01060981.1:389-835(+)